MTRKLLILAAAILLGGCNQGADLSDLRAFTENAFKDHVPEVDPLPALKPQAVFIYTASNLPDPFDTENLKEKLEETPIDYTGVDGPDPNRRKEPLEAFPIDALRLVGVLAQNEENWAVIRAPDGTVHRVKRGNHAGVNFGEIVAVNDNTVDVSELVRNPVGQWERKPASLLLVE